MEVKKLEIIPEDVYEPHGIELVFTTREEAAVIYSLFNHPLICDYLRNNSTIKPDDIRVAISVLDRDCRVEYSKLSQKI